MNLLAILTTGLFAGGLSCAAVQGGLLTGLITRQRSTASETIAALAPQTTVAGEGTGSAAPARWSTRLADDLTPVGGFLAGKLASHTLFGALLGTLGGAVQLSLGMRTWLQIGAGVLIVTFGLAQLGVPGLRRIVIEPPASWTRLVRSQARSQAALAPALLGLATILIPCGVTLSVAALALASGSPWQGAAIMAVFVLGTGPLFAVLGYAARLTATAWRGKLSLATGLVVLAMGLYTLNGGLELAGSPLAANRITASLSPAGPAPDAAAASIANGTQTVTITARTGSYTPHTIEAAAGIPTTLVIKSDNASGCVRYLVIPDRDIEKILPASGETRIDLGVLQPGRLDYTCGMGMYSGTITIA
ncbi:MULTISPECIES: urease accessory protein UreH domain-containing protein [Nocardia]|uniref:urease accessory protein UreH domain-containing protein n=1 Tax=Nocardia TaxID=1817 RepID=UPI0002ED339C|nr:MULTISPECIES: sulfite exporter TauE/SafE family protein [Nocardia]